MNSDHHPGDSIYGQKPDQVLKGEMSMISPPIKTRRKRRTEIDVRPRTTLFRVTPEGDEVFILRSGPNGFRKITVELFEGDQLKSKKQGKKR